MMSDVWQSHWDTELTRFSQELVPSDETLAAAKSTADRLFRVLQEKSKFSIDRPIIMGSIGKKTAIRTSCDFDCDIFVNNVTVKDFKAIRSEFEDVSLLSNLNAKDVRDSGVALQLTIDGFEFDLVPAINYREHNRNTQQQHERVLSQMRSLPNPVRDGRRYVSSIVEWQVEFIKRQTAFVHDLIRLAKYWNKSIFLGEFIQGQSSLMELIAVSAANKEENQHGSMSSLLRAFKGFLDLIVRLPQLNIVFEMFYNRSDIDPTIAHQRPLVMDPSNPYCRNFASDLVNNPRLMQKLQKFAQTTIGRLESQYSVMPVNLHAVFQVQPSVAPDNLVSHYLPPLMSSSYLIGVYDRNGAIHPNMIVRNEVKFKGKGMAVRILQSYLWNNIDIVQGMVLSQTQLKEKVKEIIDVNIYGRSSSSGWSSSSDSHTSYDVTFEVPCGEALIRLSVRWP